MSKGPGWIRGPLCNTRLPLEVRNCMPKGAHGPGLWMSQEKHLRSPGLLIKPISGCESVSHPQPVNHLPPALATSRLHTTPLLGSRFERTPGTLHSAFHTPHLTKINCKMHSPPRTHMREFCFPFHLTSQQNRWLFYREITLNEHKEE